MAPAVFVLEVKKPAVICTVHSNTSIHCPLAHHYSFIRPLLLSPSLSHTHTYARTRSQCWLQSDRNTGFLPLIGGP